MCIVYLEATAPRVEIPEDKIGEDPLQSQQRSCAHSGLKNGQTGILQNIAGKSIGKAAMGSSERWWWWTGGGDRKKDLESCHVDRSTADAAVELLTRKKLSKNGVYCQLSLIGRPIETLT
ncbi:hypothetical protein DFH09DRAFT_1089996 [Mycena vulgaris]|nr:hypothetical protein DFH09DRAFT_1089996 [Mycena vulgaris]